MTSEIEQEAIRKIIAQDAAKATAIAALPIPFIDMIGVVYIQVKMIEKIANQYNIIMKPKQKVYTTTILTTMTAKLISETLNTLAEKTHLDKLMGQSMVEATIVGSASGAIGEIYNLHFKRGGTIDNLGFDALMEYVQWQIADEKLSIQHLSQKLLSLN